MREVFGEITFLEYIDTCPREAVGIVHKRFVAIEFSAFLERTCPCGDRCEGLGGDGLSFAPSAVVVDDGPVRGFVFEVAVRRDEDARHHGKASGGGGNEVAHHVSIVIFARPDHAALGADDLRSHVVDECVAIVKVGGFKLVLELLVKDLLEQELEGLIIVLGDRVLA